MISGVDRLMEVVESTVADQYHLSGDVESTIVVFSVVNHRKLHVKIGIVDVGILHIGEESLVKMETEFVLSLGQGLQRHLIS